MELVTGEFASVEAARSAADTLTARGAAAKVVRKCVAWDVNPMPGGGEGGLHTFCKWAMEAGMPVYLTRGCGFESREISYGELQEIVNGSYTVKTPVVSAIYAAVNFADGLKDVRGILQGVCATDQGVRATRFLAEEAVNKLKEAQYRIKTLEEREERLVKALEEHEEESVKTHQECNTLRGELRESRDTVARYEDFYNAVHHAMRDLES